jgi:hypothetical protein
MCLSVGLQCNSKGQFISEKGNEYLSWDFSVLEAHITAMSKEDLTAHIQDLQKFFLDGLNFRFRTLSRGAY